jgi:hypothetical protein
VLLVVSTWSSSSCDMRCCLLLSAMEQHARMCGCSGSIQVAVKL